MKPYSEIKYDIIKKSQMNDYQNIENKIFNHRHNIEVIKLTHLYPPLEKLMTNYYDTDTSSYALCLIIIKFLYTFCI